MHSLLWIIIAIIIYGSLFPFNFFWVDITEIMWLDWGVNLGQRTTNGDILSNFLTFVPLGYVAFFCMPDNTKVSIKRPVIILIIGFLFAYFLQVAQFFLPSRVPTVADALINFWGIFTGVVVAVGIQQLLIKNPKLEHEWPRQYSVPFFLTGCWLLYHLFPFFPEFSINNIALSLSPVWSAPYFVLLEWVFQSIFWWCFFDLLQRNPWTSVGYPMAIGLLISLMSIEVIIANNTIDLTLILAAMTGMLLAFEVSLNQKRLILLVLVMLAIFLRGIQPWYYKELPADISFNWMPFKRYLSGSMWENTQLFLEKLFTFGCLIFYAQEYFVKKLNALLVTLGVIVVMLLAFNIMAIGVTDITDPILLLVIAYAYSQLSKPIPALSHKRE